LYGNYYGWTKDADLGLGIEAFVRAGGRYIVITEGFLASTITMTAVRNELASGRPPVFAVDTDGDGTEDRFVAVAGVNSEAGVDYYGSYTGWDTELHWYEYRPAAAGVPWGVATVHTIALAYGVFPPAKVALERLVNNLIFFKEYINRLSWEPNTDNLSRILRYKIYRKVTHDPDSAFGLLAEVDVSSNGYDDRGLKSGTGFTYRITSVDESGRESPPAVVRGPK
ncbi:MAG TPA: fibronectin type III domain-containing protein, partial [Acidobacteriota bacterium]|nr:fibronectin type III domain-containing protein [Acidobacteriota bacterium]